MSYISRREAINHSALLAAAAAAASPGYGHDDEAKAIAKKGSVNDRLRVAVVGVNGRGMSHVGGFAGKNNCEVTTICDADSAVIGRAMKEVTQKQGAEPKFEQDFRKLLDNKEIDIIAIATPNHWHATMAVWAMQAGKDVYCEKPATHNVREGRLMVEAARKNNRICQVGTQSRSTAGMRQSIQYIHDGKIGKVDLAYATCYKSRRSIGKVAKATEPPKSIDYNLWCGPAAMQPVMRAKLHYDWHWVYEYGNGDLGNQGVHEMDKARWGLKKATMPISVVSVGGRFGYVDDGNTANTQLSLFDYGDAKLIFEVRGLDTKDYKGAKVGNIWFGTEGYVVCPSYSSGTVFDRDGKKITEFKGGGDDSHFGNFVKAVRSRKVSDLNCDVEEGHQSAALCHLANISYRLGNPVTIGDNVKSFDGCDAAKEAFARMQSHLTENKVTIAEAKGLAGVKLTIDAKGETISDAGGADLAKAKAMLFREYRKGFDIEKSA
jgi:predicted dehydrogenase